MKWKILPAVKAETTEQFPEISAIVLQLLINRGLNSQEQIDEFLNPDYSVDIHDPNLFIDMDKAVARLVLAKQKKHKVCVYGDYDADGITGTTILKKTLTYLDINNLYYIPNRENEGYGLNKKAIDKIAEQGAKIIITVDCGISNNTEVEYAKKTYGIDIIITDHHDIPDKLPPAIAIIHARLERETYPFKYLSGGATAFKLAQGLLRADFFALEKKAIEIQEKWLLDLVAISIIADIMPVIGENRTLVKYGLIVLQKTKHIGLQKIYESANIDPSQIDTQKIGWQITPRLNAAGRLEDASMAVDLLITTNIERAIMIARQLNLVNQERQKMTEDVFAAALLQAEERLAKSSANEAIIVVGDDWVSGIVGLVAGRLTNKFYRPAYVLTKKGNDYIGSGRSIQDYNITKSLHEYHDLFIKFGGHAAACGFTLKGDKLDEFKSKIYKYSSEELAEQKLEPTICIDKVISIGDCNWNLYESTNLFQPFGESNTEPIFAMYDLEIIDWRTVGNDDKHLRLTLQKDGIIKKGIAFGFGEWGNKIKIGSCIDIAFKLGVNEWNGNRELQLYVEDLKLSTE